VRQLTPLQLYTDHGSVANKKRGRAVRRAKQKVNSPYSIYLRKPERAPTAEPLQLLLVFQLMGEQLPFLDCFVSTDLAECTQL
jgi:hypothetical protein